MLFESLDELNSLPQFHSLLWHEDGLHKIRIVILSRMRMERRRRSRVEWSGVGGPEGIAIEAIVNVKFKCVRVHCLL